MKGSLQRAKEVGNRDLCGGVEVHLWRLGKSTENIWS
jgi:hypothetical protein